jgi:hypothetical protein
MHLINSHETRNHGSRKHGIVTCRQIESPQSGGRPTSQNVLKLDVSKRNENTAEEKPRGE